VPRTARVCAEVGAQRWAPLNDSARLDGMMRRPGERLKGRARGPSVLEDGERVAAPRRHRHGEREPPGLRAEDDRLRAGPRSESSRHARTPTMSRMASPVLHVPVRDDGALDLVRNEVAEHEAGDVAGQRRVAGDRVAEKSVPAELCARPQPEGAPPGSYDEPVGLLGFEVEERGEALLRRLAGESGRELRGRGGDLLDRARLPVGERLCDRGPSGARLARARVPPRAEVP
jgi:hypothetical protein